MLLAAFGERRPTRDIDLQAQALDSDAENVRVVIGEVAAGRLDDGVVFDVDGATAAVIRDEDAYSGVRVTRVVMLVAGLDVQIIGFDGSPLRHLIIDPSVDYRRRP